MLFNTTFNNISAILYQSVFLVEESELPSENHRHITSRWQKLSHNVLLSTYRHERVTIPSSFVIYIILISNTYNYSWIKINWSFCFLFKKCVFIIRSSYYHSSSSGILVNGGLRHPRWYAWSHSSHRICLSGSCFPPHTQQAQCLHFLRGLSKQWSQSGLFFPENIKDWIKETDICKGIGCHNWNKSRCSKYFCTLKIFWWQTDISIFSVTISIIWRNKIICEDLFFFNMTGKLRLFTWSGLYIKGFSILIQGSRCRSPMSQFAIYFLDWRLKLASGDFLAPRFPCVHLSIITVYRNKNQ